MAWPFFLWLYYVNYVVNCVTMSSKYSNHPNMVSTTPILYDHHHMFPVNLQPCRFMFLAPIWTAVRWTFSFVLSADYWPNFCTWRSVWKFRTMRSQWLFVSGFAIILTGTQENSIEAVLSWFSYQFIGACKKAASAAKPQFLLHSMQILPPPQLK